MYDSDLPRIQAFQEVAQWRTTAPQPQAELHDPCEEFIPGLTARPYWESEEERGFATPWVEELEGRSGDIIEEFFEVMEREVRVLLLTHERGWLYPKTNLFSQNAERAAKLKKEQELKAMYDIPSDSRDLSLFSSDSAWQNDVMGAGWSAVRLQRLGEWNAENCARFPRTYEIIRSLDIPLAVRGVCFARQTPGSGVFPHSDGRNFILTSHLGIKIPEAGCSMKVGTEIREWTEGKVVTLDTSFVHSTKNDSDEDRYVLIIDFWHPELTDIERKSLEYVYDLRNKFERGEVPVRPLRKDWGEDPGETEGKGLAGLWASITGKK